MSIGIQSSKRIGGLLCSNLRETKSLPLNLERGHSRFHKGLPYFMFHLAFLLHNEIGSGVLSAIVTNRNGKVEIVPIFRELIFLAFFLGFSCFPWNHLEEKGVRKRNNFSPSYRHPCSISALFLGNDMRIWERHRRDLGQWRSVSNHRQTDVGPRCGPQCVVPDA